jgi:hypothetical protein
LPPDDTAAERPSYCHFHGIVLLRVGSNPTELRSTVGRVDQCGLVKGRYTTCTLVREGKSADWDKCPYNPSNADQLRLL